jgi:hypothetical protein
MHRPFDVAQRRASRTNARDRKVRGAADKIEKNLTHSMLAVSSVRVPTYYQLGLAVTLEFVGPLGVAIAGSRRALDAIWIVLAAIGIALIAPWLQRSRVLTHACSLEVDHP